MPPKIRMSRQVKLFLQSLPPEEQEALLDTLTQLPAQVASGEAERMSPEEVQRLKDEEGLDLEAIVREMDTEDEQEN